jgi:hypothetical protein
MRDGSPFFFLLASLAPVDSARSLPQQSNHGSSAFFFSLASLAPPPR